MSTEAVPLISAECIAPSTHEAPELRFQVIGDAKPGGSKKAFKHPHTGRIIVTDASGKGGRTWRQDVKAAAIEAMGRRTPLEGPLEITATFFRSRPRSHESQSKKGGLLDSAPMWPATRPDTTKLFRAVEDALTHIVYKDDAQVVAQHIYKRFGDPPRVEIEVRLVSPERAGDARFLPLRDKDGNVLAYTEVDPDLYPEFSRFAWCLKKGYAARGTMRGGVQRQFALHREVMGVTDADVAVDHINGDPLDNRRVNLRCVRHSENSQNVRLNKGFRGVSWHRAAKKWVAQVKVDGATKHLGLFEDPIAAGIAAEQCRKEHMPYAEPDPVLAEALRTGELPTPMQTPAP